MLWRSLTSGGFCITRYLSASPGGIKEAFLTGGLPPLVHEPNAALPAYRKLLHRVAAQNKKFYKRFPGDVKARMRGSAPLSL